MDKKLEINIERIYKPGKTERVFSDEGLDAPKSVSGVSVVDELDPFHDLEFRRAFADSKLPVNQIGLVYEGWKMCRFSELCGKNYINNKVVDETID